MDRFARPLEGRWVAGVCAGVARRTGIDVIAVRIIAVLLAGGALPACIALWAFTPSEG